MKSFRTNLCALFTEFFLLLCYGRSFVSLSRPDSTPQRDNKWGPTGRKVICLRGQEKALAGRSAGEAVTSSSPCPPFNAVIFYCSYSRFFRGPPPPPPPPPFPKPAARNHNDPKRPREQKLERFALGHYKLVGEVHLISARLFRRSFDRATHDRIDHHGGGGIFLLQNNQQCSRLLFLLRLDAAHNRMPRSPPRPSSTIITTTSDAEWLKSQVSSPRSAQHEP